MAGRNQMQDQRCFQSVLRELVIVQQFRCLIIISENNMLRKFRREEKITTHVALTGFEIVDEIGRGGMGVVYQAVSNSGESVALKICGADTVDLELTLVVTT